MVKPVIGDVVVLPFPQTDLQVGKRRPALVAADLAGDDLILCQITSKSHHRDSYSIPLLTTDFGHGGLNLDSHIRANRLFTVDHAVVIYVVGSIKRDILEETRAKICDLFR
ncbi:MAG: type II toxin-antitoxin system PemK/MazF family toxin [Pyrinomonadaceae bacterium]